MGKIIKTVSEYESGVIGKHEFIQSMYSLHHAQLFDYSYYLSKTNIKKIEIIDDKVIMTTRDRGLKFECIPGDHRIAPIETLNFFDYEKKESTVVEKLISESNTFFDIGANIGFYSINLAMIKRSMNVHSFEPIPSTFHNLNRNIELNGIKNIKTHNLGFSDKKGDFDFYVYSQGSGNASSVNLTGRDDVKVLKCEVTTLDDYVSTTGLNVDFIKCDVEGAELLVLKGGHSTIRQNLPIIFCEILRKWTEKFSYNSNDILDMLRAIGYRVFTVKGSSLIGFESIDDSTIDTNFFFLHPQKHLHLIRRFSE